MAEEVDLVVVLVENHPILSHAVAASLRSLGIRQVEVVHPEHKPADDLLDEITRLGAAVVLLDLHLGDWGTGEVLVPALREHDVQVVLLTASDDRRLLGRAIEAGAAGIVQKEESFEVLVDAVRRVAAGESLISAGEREDWRAELHALEHDDRERLERFKALSPSERIVLAGLMDGLSVEELSSRRFVSVETTRSQVKALTRKLGVRSQLAAVALARRHGWTPDSG